MRNTFGALVALLATIAVADPDTKDHRLPPLTLKDTSSVQSLAQAKTTGIEASTSSLTALGDKTSTLSKITQAPTPSLGTSKTGWTTKFTKKGKGSKKQKGPKKTAVSRKDACPFQTGLTSKKDVSSEAKFGGKKFAPSKTAETRSTTSPNKEDYTTKPRSDPPRRSKTSKKPRTTLPTSLTDDVYSTKPRSDPPRRSKTSTKPDSTQSADKASHTNAATKPDATSALSRRDAAPYDYDDCEDPGVGVNWNRDEDGHLKSGWPDSVKEQPCQIQCKSNLVLVFYTKYHISWAGCKIDESAFKAAANRGCTMTGWSSEGNVSRPFLPFPAQ